MRPALVRAPRAGVDRDEAVGALDAVLDEELLHAAVRHGPDGHVKLGRPRRDAERRQQGQILVDHVRGGSAAA